MDSKALTVTPGAWSAEAAEYIGRALVHATPAEVEGQVQEGAALFYVHEGEKLIGCYVLRVDRTHAGPEGVIVAAGGDACGVDLVAALLPTIEKQFNGVRGVRIHTSRSGMAKKLGAAGYKLKELVFAKAM